jgi:hypothetical protein
MLTYWLNTYRNGNFEIFEFEVNDIEKDTPTILEMSRAMENGYCLIYSRTSASDIKKDIQDDRILQGEKFSNEESWHATNIGYKQDGGGKIIIPKIIEEYGTYAGKPYNVFKYENLLVRLKMIQNKNIRPSFYLIKR